MEPNLAKPDDPVVNIVGERVALGPLRRDLMSLYHRWDNDFEVNVALAEVGPQTREATEAWYERASRGDLHARVGFTIYERATMRPIGTANLHMIDHLHKTAFFGMAIGEKDCWGKGYGTETARLVLDYGFTLLSLHSIRLTAYSFNEAGIRAYTRAGFRPIGRWREAIRLGGRAYDVLYMDCLATEFTHSALAGLLPPAEQSSQNDSS
jgi:RimJ/RimL family protein N-acetyltransferase